MYRCECNLLKIEVCGFFWKRLKRLSTKQKFADRDRIEILDSKRLIQMLLLTGIAIEVKSNEKCKTQVARYIHYERICSKAVSCRGLFLLQCSNHSCITRSNNITQIGGAEIQQPND